MREEIKFWGQNKSVRSVSRHLSMFKRQAGGFRHSETEKTKLDDLIQQMHGGDEISQLSACYCPKKIQGFPTL